MIKFFRRIRQKLLQENRFSKYLLYAIGEIILVVIGILIALQINNWNTSKKETQELKDYLLKISENVSEDLVVAASHLKQREQLTNLSKKTIHHLVNGQIDSLSLTKTVEIFVDFRFMARKGGFQSLTNSGYMGKIKRSKLDSLLFQYYINVDDLIREEQSFNGYMEALEASSSASISILPFAKQYYGYSTDPGEYKKANKQYYESAAIQNAIIRSSGQAQLLRKYKALISTGNLLNEEIGTHVTNLEK